MRGSEASASDFGARGFLASTSTTTGDSRMRCDPSFELCLQDDGETDNDAGLPSGRMSISNWGPLL